MLEVKHEVYFVPQNISRFAVKASLVLSTSSEIYVDNIYIREIFLVRLSIMDQLHQDFNCIILIKRQPTFIL